MSDTPGQLDPVHPFGPGSRAPLADSRAMPDCYPIKGNIRDDGVRYYHRPDSRSYGATRAEVWFDSPSAAEAAGFVLAPTHPAGTTSAPFEPGGSSHPCTAEAVEANRMTARGGTAQHPYGPGSHATLADAREMPACYPIKGNVRDDGILYYHRPDSRSYGATKAEVWFDSPSAAEAAGFTLAPTHDGSSGVSYEPGGSNHPCTIEAVDANRAAVRAATGATTPATLVGAATGGPQGEDGMAIEPGRPAFDSGRHPYGVGSHTVGADPKAAPVGYPIKGNVRRDGSRRYHRPDSTAYGTTNAEVWFDSPSAAEAAEFSLAASHPTGGDAARFEPGGDGHSWSRAEVGEARIRALYGPGGAADAGISSGSSTDKDADAGSIGVGGLGAAATGLGLLAAGAAALGRTGHDADLHPFGIGSHQLLANAIDMPRFHPIKGNVRKDGSRLYHRPDSSSYSVTKPEVWFDSPTAAEGAGFLLAPTHPAGATAGDFEPGGPRHPWSADDVNTARLRFLHGPDWSGQLDDPAAATAGMAAADGGADGRDASGGVGTAAVVAGAGAAALAGAAIAGALGADDADHSPAEALGASTLELPGPVTAAASQAAASRAAGDTDIDGLLGRADTGDTADLGSSSSDPGEQVTTRLSRPAGRTDPDTDPDTGDAAGAAAGDDDDTVGGLLPGAAAAGAAGLGLAAGAAYLAGRGGDDTADAAGIGSAGIGSADIGSAGIGSGIDPNATVEAALPDRQPPVGRDRRRDAAAGLAASGLAAGAAGSHHPGADYDAGGPDELGAAAGRRVTGAAASGGHLTALDGGGGGRRRFGLWGWLAAGAAAVVLLSLLLSMCGGSANTNEATDTGAKGSALASTTAAGSGSAPAGPDASTAGASTTLTATASASSGSSASSSSAPSSSAPSSTVPSTTAAPAAPAANATADLQVRALAALNAAGFKNVQVEVTSGTVRLLGNVASAADAKAAEAALNGMAGMTGVDNALVVAETPAANAVAGNPRYTG